MRERRFWNLFAKKYSKSPVKGIKGYNHTLNITKKYLNKKQIVLEIGCGTGTTAIKLASNVKQYVATDISPNMIKIGKEKARNVKNITFYESGLFNQNLKKNSYDVILGYNIIHLLDDRDKAMKRINELLKKDGLFISKTACLGEKKIIMYPLSLILTPLIGPIKCFTLTQYRESLKKNGFNLIKEHVYEDSRILTIAKKSDKTNL